MLRVSFFLLAFLSVAAAFSQKRTNALAVKILSPQSVPLSCASVELLKVDSSLLKITVSDSSGHALFTDLHLPQYLLRVTRIGYATAFFTVRPGPEPVPITLQAAENTLDGVTVSTRKPFLELKPGRTVVNVDAVITNVGATVLEALEKLPGVSVDKDGNIGLKGRTNVTVMLDGKPTFLTGEQLTSLLTGMSVSQLSQIELIDVPPASFDAAGNAGVINLKFRKTTQAAGFNGSLSTSYTQGFYPKTNNTLNLNYRASKANVFLTYSLNAANNFIRVYARRVYAMTARMPQTTLEQPSFMASNGTSHHLRTGVDYTLSAKTSLGATFSGFTLDRSGNGNNQAGWQTTSRMRDSVINTYTRNNSNWINGVINANLRHRFSEGKELAFDADHADYRIRGQQALQHVSSGPRTYTETLRAATPSNLQIYSAKLDYSQQAGTVKVETGWKSSYIKTENQSVYESFNGTVWREDYGKSNHFLYNETIHALYGSAQTKTGRLSVQGGLRYEWTGYDARQLGNALVKDSSFSRQYSGFFPTLSASFEKDSAHTFSVTATRRIDRPGFQKLNPFVFIINKYTYQRGNPYYRPQFTWSFELSHVYKNALITALTYSNSTDYFSQIFPTDSNGIVLYTEGNLGRLQNLGASVTLQLAPVSLWSFSLQAGVNRKKMEGNINGARRATITQYNANLTNQFRFGKGWTGELNAFYFSASQQDIQEVLDPYGQLSIGFGKTVFNGKGTVKLALRDLFYTNWMKGVSQFSTSTETFKITRDSRLAVLSFNWRFGKTFKAARRSEGAAGEELQRVGND